MRRFRLAPLALLAVLVAAPALGQTPPPDKKKEEEARGAYELGIRAYNVADYPQAVSEFKRAYLLTGATPLLFNIAQAHRLAGDCKQAVFFYRKYLNEERPSAQNETDRKKASDLMKELEPCKDGATSPVTTTPPPPPPPGPEKAPPPPPDIVQEEIMPTPDGSAPAGPEPRSGRTLKIAGLVTGGASLIPLGLGLYFGKIAADKKAEVEEFARAYTGTDLRNDPDFMKLDSDGKSAQQKQIVLLVSGGALAVGGGVLYYLGMRRDAASTQVTMVPTDGGAALILGGRF